MRDDDYCSRSIAARLATFGAALMLATGGCATITTGRNQPVSVETVGCQAARCQLTNQKGVWYVSSTPGSVLVHKAYGDMTVVCDKGQYRSNPHVIPSAVRVETFGNILIGGLIGATVDASTGAAWDYPAVISVQMVCAGDPKTVMQPPAPIFARNQSTGNDTVAMPSPNPNGGTAAARPMPATPIAQAPTGVIAPAALPAQVPEPVEAVYVPAANGGLARVEPIPAKSVMPVRKDARYQFDAEHYAKAQGCLQPIAVMNFYAPGAETYSVSCGDREPLSVRCEFGKCRALQ